VQETLEQQRRNAAAAVGPPRLRLEIWVKPG
jgi:hypothetical protein